MDNELEHLRKEVERLQKALNDRQQVSVASPALIENQALLEALIRAHGNDDPSGERADIYPGSEKKRR